MMKLKKPVPTPIALLSKNDGFTTLEVVITLFLTLIINIALWHGFGTVNYSLETVFRTSSQERLALELYNKTMEQFDAVTMPFFLKEAAVNTSTNRLSIKYYKGLPEEPLLIWLKDDVLTLSADQKLHQFSPVNAMTTELLKDKEEHITGLLLHYQLESQTVTVSYHFLGVS